MPFYHRRIIATVALTASLMGAATAAPVPVPEPLGAPAQQMRLEAVGYRLAIANAAGCEYPTMRTGLILHDIGSYPASERARVRQTIGLGYGFGILGVVPGSPAQAAGLEPGDEIIALDGADLRTLAAEHIGRAASMQRTEVFVDKLEPRLDRGPASLTVRRGAQVRVVMLRGEPGCGGYVEYRPNSKLNAWATGIEAVVPRGMIDTARDDDELAFVVAHEMAHNILGHDEYRMSGLLVDLGIGSGQVKRREMDADRLSVRLMMRAGYDVDGAERLLRLISPAVDPAITHPGTSRRVQIIKAAAAIARISADGSKPS